MIAIRRAAPSDAALLAWHRAAVWDESGGHDEAETRAQVPVWTDWMAEAIARRTYVAFIAFDGDDAAGSASLLVHDAVPRPGYVGRSDGRVHSVFVEPAMRRRGIARALMHDLLDYARSAGVMRLTLHPTSASRSLYAGLNFEQLDEMGVYLRA